MVTQRRVFQAKPGMGGAVVAKMKGAVGLALGKRGNWHKCGTVTGPGFCLP